MASTFSTNLAIELIGTGDQAGTWGATTNSNLGTLIEQAISGYVTQAVVTGTDTTITIPNGSTGVARNMYIELTGTGGTNTNLIVPANKKLYFIFNNSTGAVTVKVSGQTGVSVPTGKKMVLVSNGTDIVNGLNYIADFGTNSFTVTNLTATSATITNLIATTASVSDLSATVSRSASATITNLIATSASITTVTNSPTFSAGTANGVAYLNGSKALTTGSALTFDGASQVTLNGSTTNSALSVKSTVSETSLQNISNDGFLNMTGTGGMIFRLGSGYTEQMRLTSTGLGIGTSSPAVKLDVVGFTNITNASTALSGTAKGTLRLYDSTAMASGVGAGLAFLGQATTGSGAYTTAGSIQAYKVNGTSGNDAFGLQFTTRSNGSGCATVMSLDDSGNLGLGVTPSGSWDSPALMLGKPGASNPTYPFLTSTDTQQLVIGSNSYWDGTNWKAAFAGSAVVAMQQRIKYNEITWHTAAAVSQGSNQSFTQAMTLDASGNLVVGGTSAVITGAGRGNITINGSSTAIMALSVGGTAKGSFYHGGTNLEIINYHSGGNLDFYVNGDYRARIDSSGNLLVGTATAGAGVGYAVRLAVDGGGAEAGIFKTSAGTSAYSSVMWNTATTGDNLFVLFGTEGTITTRGSITYNRAGGAVAYNTTSDYRAKDIIGPVQNSGAAIDALKVYMGKMKGATLERPMLVAHEAQEIAPYCVTGDKDAVNNDGTPKYQQMDVSALVPLLLAEIQSLRARVAQLESK